MILHSDRNLPRPPQGWRRSTGSVSLVFVDFTATNEPAPRERSRSGTERHIQHSDATIRPNELPRGGVVPCEIK
jgi:hypothetical protein